MKREPRRKGVRFLALMLLAGALIILISGSISLSKRRQSRIAANEVAAVNTLRILHAALMRYVAAYPATGFPASLTQLSRSGKLPSCASAGILVDSLAQDAFTNKGYDFSYMSSQPVGSCPAKESSPADHYTISAAPSFPGYTGSRYFYLDSSGVIRASQTKQAGPEADPIESALLGADSSVTLPKPQRVAYIRGVRFDHQQHIEVYEVNCPTCHHASMSQKPMSVPYQACTTCHQRVIRIPMQTNSRKAFHDMKATSGTCIDCHKSENEKGRTAPVRCRGCHTH